MAKIKLSDTMRFGEREFVPASPERADEGLVVRTAAGAVAPGERVHARIELAVPGAARLVQVTVALEGTVEREGAARPFMQVSEGGYDTALEAGQALGLAIDVRVPEGARVSAESGEGAWRLRARALLVDGRVFEADAPVVVGG